MRLDDTLDPNQRFDLSVEPIAHQFKFPVGRDKADRSIILESTQSHALMELDIFHLDRLAPCCSTCRLEHDLIV